MFLNGSIGLIYNIQLFQNLSSDIRSILWREYHRLQNLVNLKLQGKLHGCVANFRPSVEVWYNYLIYLLEVF